MKKLLCGSALLLVAMLCFGCSSTISTASAIVLSDEGITIVVVTHESGVANETNKIVHIKDGLIERIEMNLDHNASPFGSGGLMK